MAPDMQAAIDAATATLTRVVPQPVAVGYGVDLVCRDDLTAGLSEWPADSREGIAQALIHRLGVDRDMTVIRYDDPNYGFQLLGLLHRGTRTQDIAQMEGDIADECQKDDRVASVVVDGSISLGPPVSLSFKVQVTPVNPDVGVFTFVVSVGPDGVASELLA